MVKGGRCSSSQRLSPSVSISGNMDGIKPDLALEPNPDQRQDEPGTFIDSDQQIYDWGIENRLEQYYPTNHSQQMDQQVDNPVNAVMSSNHIPHAPFHSATSQTTEYLQDSHQAPFQQQQYDVSSNPQSLSASNQYSYNTSVVSPGNYSSMSESMETSPNQDSDIKPFSSLVGRRPMVPTVDMDANEILKIERKRARNRLAASKCRMRKLEKIAVLDDQARLLREENDKLVAFSDKLRTQVYELKQELRWHVNNGCKLMNSGSKALVDAASPDSTTPVNSPSAMLREDSHGSDVMVLTPQQANPNEVS